MAAKKKETPEANKWWVAYLQKAKTWDGAVEVPIDSLEPDPLNPNEMDDVQLDMLREDINAWKFDEPIQVVPIPEAEGKFRIVGGEHRWLACFCGDTPVVTKRGILAISQVVVGDAVMSTHGVWAAVTDVSMRPYRGRFCAVRLCGMKIPLVSTEDHPYMVDGQEVKACKLLPGKSWIRVPRPCLYSPTAITIPSHMVSFSPKDDTCSVASCRNSVHAGGLCFGHYKQKQGYKKAFSGSFRSVKQQPRCSVEGCSSTVKTKNLCTYHYNRSAKVAPNRVCLTPFSTKQLLDTDLLWLFGFYVAEGSAVRERNSGGRVRGICFTIGKKDIERGFLARLRDIVRAKFGLRCSVYKKTSSRDGYDVKVFSPTLGSWFESLFGRFSYGKTLPSMWIGLPKDKARALLDGVASGDGYASPDGMIRITTVSKDLAYQLFLLCVSAEFAPSIYCSKDTTEQRRDSYIVAYTPARKQDRRYGKILDADGLLLRVSDVVAFEDCNYVWNMSVETTNIFNVGGCLVHNCKKVGMTTIPIVVKEGWMDEVVRLENLVRRNENRGTRNPTKLRRIILDLRTERRLKLSEEARRFGFSREDKFKEILEERESAKQEAAKNRSEEDDETSKHVRDNLDYAVRNILSEYGSTAPKGHIFFCYKDQVHLVLQMESGLTSCIKEMADACEKSDLQMSDYLEGALRSRTSGGVKEVTAKIVSSPPVDDIKAGESDEDEDGDDDGNDES